MKIRTIQFRSYTIEIWKYGKRVFYYPSVNDDAEFTTYKECCSYLRHWDRCNKILIEYTGTGMNVIQHLMDHGLNVFF